ncbi:polycystic kidney disease protein 1-like 2 [Thalassophryne amazonica]|uniref:polycystic kidney disease protein 1-like 2 n=1 Tax=Thalassophryne amazonica TaxID=390379 RepID=UPI001471BF5E|nr:polycystic kidney disease protein 1-like 2 [Thalassophryne amazonica]
MSVVRGVKPQNITVSLTEQFGTGCHHLSLYASNVVTFPEVYKKLQICVLEKVAGLQVSLVKGGSLNHSELSVEVSLEQGAPVLLHFFITGNMLFSETREMLQNAKSIYHIAHPFQAGSSQVKLKAWNVFSSLVVDTATSCDKKSVLNFLNCNNGATNTTNNIPNKKVTHIRSIRSPIKINVSPLVLHKKSGEIVLTASGGINNKNKEYFWECNHPCQCQISKKALFLNYTIDGNCLPEPYHFFKYYFIEKNKNDSQQTKMASTCITLTPKLATSFLPSLNCFAGCDGVTSTDVKLKLHCSGTCPQVVWYTEDLRPDTDWEPETKSCYQEAKRRPLIHEKDGGNEYTVQYSRISQAKKWGQDITVLVTYVPENDDNTFYTTYTLKVSSSTTNPVSSATTATSGVPQITVNSATAQTPARTTGSAGKPSATQVSTKTTTGSAESDATTAPAMTGATTASTTPSLSCSISPQSGTIMDAFNIICQTKIPCLKCQYCFKTNEGKHLRCSDNNQLKFVYLPLGDSASNYNLLIMATARDKSSVYSTTITTQVRNSSSISSPSVSSLQAAVDNNLAQLEEQDLLSGHAVGQLFDSVAKTLSGLSDDPEKDARQKLLEQMLDVMVRAVKDVPPKSLQDVQVTASGLSAIIHTGIKLKPKQDQALLLLRNLSSSLLSIDLDKSEENKKEIYITASIIVEGTSDILEYPSSKNTSDALTQTLNNIQSALLLFKEPNEDPAIIQEGHIGMFVKRVTTENLQTELISITNTSSPKFSLPKLPSNIINAEETVDIRMLSFEENPFSWNGRGNISGFIGGLSLSAKNGSTIPVENLSKDIEIILPRLLDEKVNTSILDLKNYSTVIINVASADSTLVLKLVPSEDPLTFKVFLGHEDYPTDTNHIAMTQMPQQGSTPDERYTWLVDANTLKGNTGTFYLLVRPIVGPGIKSIDANLSVNVIASECRYWNELKLDWSTYGCRVGVQTTHLVTQCFCNHLSFFGSSFFVTPNLVDPSRTAELFATFAENPVVVCFVGSLFGAYLLAVVWARRKDLQDTEKVKMTVLEDNNPMDEYRYLLTVNTGHRRGASTTSQVTITILGAEANSEPHHLTDPKDAVFDRGGLDMFLLTTPFSLGDLQAIRLWHNSSGRNPAWYVNNVMVKDLQTEQKWYFLCNTWLAIDIGDCSLDKVFLISSENELKKFSNLFFMKTIKDFSDGHLWYSVISRPPSSTFTRVQRVSCCFSLLICTMLTSIMFYGIPTDPSEQTMDLGCFEFTWQQFMIGVQSSLIMFPVNLLIVSVFRNTRPRDSPCCKRKGKKSDDKHNISQLLSSQAAIMKSSDISLDTILKDITRIAHSFPQSVKSNIPCTQLEFDPGQEDINAVLSSVDNFIRQNNKNSDINSKTQCFEDLTQTKQPESGMSPDTRVEGIKKMSNKSWYLYRQLCLIDKELSLSESSIFPTTHSYNQAVQQVKSMKTFLEDQLFTSKHEHLEELTHKKSSPAGSTNGHKMKKTCCHGGLPWWFVFVGWLLLIATSCVAGYFTMLYGLKFGKEQSISWLVSMIVSFFQSILIIQPLKVRKGTFALFNLLHFCIPLQVICIAIFFALVLKKVEDDSQNLEFAHIDRIPDDIKGHQTIRRDNKLYEPPPAADIEQMKRKKIKEEKAFAILWEILTYIFFMWMLLLVAYGQRDLNAFLLNQHIEQSFTVGISDSMDLANVFAWANTSLLRNLFGIYPGFITDGNSKLVGNARLRQVRVKKNSCQIANSMLQFVPICHALYSWEVEDMGSYDPGWNHSIADNMSHLGPWTYQTQAELQAYPVWGQMVLYRGGGFAAELGPDLQNAIRTLQYLFENKWLDVYTRAIFVEFTVYNANVNLFCIVTLLLETTATGAFQFDSELQSVRLYPSTGGLHIFVLTAEIIYLLFILYYMFLQAKLMKQQRCAYFKSKWNLLELTIIVISWSAVIVFVKRTLLRDRDMSFYHQHKDQFVSFHDTAAADTLLQYLIAFLVLLSTIKLWHLLRLNPKMALLTATLQRAWNDILSYIVVIVIMIIAYSIACNLIYGWQMTSYKTLMDAVLTIISLQIGIFDYEEVLNYNLILGALMIGSCIVFMTFVVLNLFISVILVAFSQEQIHHKPSEEEEIVDLILMKAFSFFGIRVRDTRKQLEDEVNSSSDNDRNILNNSSSEFTESSVNL